MALLTAEFHRSAVCSTLVSLDDYLSAIRSEEALQAFRQKQRGALSGGSRTEGTTFRSTLPPATAALATGIASNYPAASLLRSTRQGAEARQSGVEEPTDILAQWRLRRRLQAAAQSQSVRPQPLPLAHSGRTQSAGQQLSAKPAAAEAPLGSPTRRPPQARPDEGSAADSQAAGAERPSAASPSRPGSSRSSSSSPRTSPSRPGCRCCSRRSHRHEHRHRQHHHHHHHEQDDVSSSPGRTARHHSATAGEDAAASQLTGAQPLPLRPPYLPAPGWAALGPGAGLPFMGAIDPRTGLWWWPGHANLNTEAGQIFGQAAGLPVSTEAAGPLSTTTATIGAAPAAATDAGTVVSAQPLPSSVARTVEAFPSHQAMDARPPPSYQTLRFSAAPVSTQLSAAAPLVSMSSSSTTTIHPVLASGTASETTRANLPPAMSEAGAFMGSFDPLAASRMPRPTTTVATQVSPQRPTTTSPRYHGDTVVGELEAAEAASFLPELAEHDAVLQSLMADAQVIEQQLRCVDRRTPGLINCQIQSCPYLLLIGRYLDELIRRRRQAGEVP